MLYPQTDATAVLVGDYLWVYGGSDANGPVGAVQRGAFGQAAAEGLPANPNAGKVIRWDVNNPANLPVARTNASGWGANGALYLAGGNDGTGPKSEVYWAIPTTDRRHPRVEAPRRHATCRRPGLEGAPAVISGPDAILVGGETRRIDDPRLEHPRQHRAAAAVLPARAGRRDRPGPEDRGRDRPAAGLPQRGRASGPWTSSC